MAKLEIPTPPAEVVSQVLVVLVSAGCPVAEIDRLRELLQVVIGLAMPNRVQYSLGSSDVGCMSIHPKLYQELLSTAQQS